MSDPQALHTEPHVCIDKDGNTNDGEMWRCIDGRVFGPCDSEYCYGVCEFKGNCTCECHSEVIASALGVVADG